MLAFGVPAPAPLHYRTLGRRDARLLEQLHAACPLEVEGGVHLSRGADFFAWPEAVLDSTAYQGAFAQGRLVASLATGIAHVSVNGTFVPALYLFDARVHPSARGRGLIDALTLRLVAENASSCALAFVVRRLDNDRAARCARIPSPVPGTVSFARPLNVVVVPPPDTASPVHSQFSWTDADAPVLARPATELLGRLGVRTFATRNLQARALVADKSSVRARLGQSSAPLDVRSLVCDDVAAADELVAGIATATGRPIRLGLGGHHPLVARLLLRGASAVACELRIIVRTPLAHALAEARTPFALDASLL